MPTPHASVCHSAYLELSLEQDLPAGLVRWQSAHERVLEDWELERCRQLLALVKRAPLDPMQRGSVLHLEGLFWEQWGDWPAAQRCVERAASLQREANNPSGEMVALNALANILRRDEQRHQEALPLYRRALEIALELDNEQAQAGILNNLGLAQYESGDFEAARPNLEQALELARRQGDRGREGRILHNLGSLACSQGRLGDAERDFSAAMEICQEQSDRVGEAESLSSLGITWEAQGDWSRAVDAYRQALGVLQGVGDIHGQAQVLTNLGSVAWLQKRYDQAIHYYESGLVLARSLGDAQVEGGLLGGLGTSTARRVGWSRPRGHYAWRWSAKRRPATGGASRSPTWNWARCCTSRTAWMRPMGPTGGRWSWQRRLATGACRRTLTSTWRVWRCFGSRRTWRRLTWIALRVWPTRRTIAKRWGILPSCAATY